MERLINKLLELRLLRSFKVKTTPRWIILLLDMLIVLISYASTVVADIYSTGTPGQSGTTLLVGLLVLLYYFIVTYISKSYTCVIRLSVIEDLYRIFTGAGFPVIRTSAETGEGVEPLRAALRGKISAFTGNSGVGKSSLLNRLLPGLNIPTAEVSEKLGRGKHTTRHVELFALGEDSFIADTPGFASFELEMMNPIPKERLQYLFPEFEPHLGRCRFLDCTHRREPGCAVTEAVGAGRIAQSRYASYLRLYDLSAQRKEWEYR